MGDPPMVYILDDISLQNHGVLKSHLHIKMMFLWREKVGNKTMYKDKNSVLQAAHTKIVKLKIQKTTFSRWRLIIHKTLVQWHFNKYLTYLTTIWTRQLVSQQSQLSVIQLYNLFYKFFNSSCSTKARPTTYARKLGTWNDLMHFWNSLANVFHNLEDGASATEHDFQK